MKRVTLLLVLSSLIGTVWMMPGAKAEGRGPCSGWFSNVRPSMPLGKIQLHTKKEIECAVRRFGPVSLDTAMYVANRESHYYPWALNPSGCAGVYQHQLAYWPGRVAQWFDKDWFWRTPSAFNMRANVIVTIRMAHVEGWGPWGL